MTRSVAHFIWLLVAVGAGQLHVMVTGAASETTLAIVSCIIGLQSVYGFLRQGGSLLNASSVALYGILLFSIFPALYTALGLQAYTHKTDIESLIVASILVGVLQWLILSLCPAEKIKIQREKLVSLSLSSNGGTFALLLFAVTLALSVDITGHLQNATGLLTIFFATLAAVTAVSLARFVLSSLLLATSFAYYAFFIFEGFGRLTLGAIGIGVLMLGTLRFSGYVIKACILSVTAPAITWLSYQRVGFLEETRGTDISFDEGIASVVRPFTSAGVIINRMLEGVIEPSLGTTLFAALVVWIPSALWSGKPPGFGSEMVPITKPHLANSEAYSDAALITGEAVWNLGVWGSILMFVIFALWVRVLDKWFAAAANKLKQGDLGITHLCRIVMIVLFSSGILNLFWGGWHTHTARLFVEVAILAVIWFVFALAADFNRNDRRVGKRTSTKNRHRQVSRL